MGAHGQHVRRVRARYHVYLQLVLLLLLDDDVKLGVSGKPAIEYTDRESKLKLRGIDVHTN